MRLKDVARHFDREPAYDGYSGALVFKCQYSSFDDSAGDGSTNRRRGMSTAPAVVIPARGCIRLGDQRWLVGSPTGDSFQGEAMRNNYNLKRVTDSLRILTAAEACADAAGTSAYAQKYYFKDTVNNLTDAEYDPFWNVFFAPTEAVAQGAFLKDASSTFYRVRQTYQVAEGFLVAQTDQLDSDARQTGVVFNTGAYNPLTDAFATGTVSTSVLQFEMTKFYRFRQQAEAVVKPGDKMVFVTTSAVTVVPGMQFTMLGLVWQVVTKQAEGAVTAIHARLK